MSSDALTVCHRGTLSCNYRCDSVTPRFSLTLFCSCDVVITDYWLGWSDGLSVLQQVRERWPRVRVIMLTGNGGEEVVAGAFKHGLHQYLLKPDGFEDIVPVVRTAFEQTTGSRT